MLHRTITLSGTVLTFVAAFVFFGSVAAQDKKQPEPKEIFEKYIKATGGREAYGKIKNVYSQGALEVSGLGVKGDMKSWHEGNKLYLEINITGIGKMMQGTDGKVAWEMNSLTGNRIKEGNEREEFLREAELHSELNWEKNYKKVECVGEEAVDGKPAYKVVCTPEKGFPQTKFYDKESGLLVKIMGKQASQMGDVEAESHMSDYRQTGGILMPFKSVIKGGGQEIVITLNKAECNVEMPKDRFALPPEIKELVK